ncbi:hypothetical protein [Amycolatopsis japonica]
MSTLSMHALCELMAQGNANPGTGNSLAAPLITASATISVAFISAALIYLSGKRDRRRELYGKAFQVAIAWEELYFRVVRRCENSENDVVDRFHSIQEDIAFYAGWIGSESAVMRRRYARLTKLVKDTLAPHIREAWSKQPKAPGEPVQNLEKLPLDALHVEYDNYLRDVRAHLSILILPRLAFIAREHFLGLAKAK